MKQLIAILSVFVLASCMKDEIPVPAHTAGNSINNSINLGTDYRHMAYYDFVTNSFVKQHEKTDWDLGFESSATGFHIILNTSKSMAASEMEGQLFAAIADTSGTNWKYDVSSGNLDSTAIGEWYNTSEVYVLDRGYSFDGTHQGFRKIEFEQIGTDEYEIHYAELDGSNEQTHTIQKNPTHNFTFFSFETNATASIEPPKDEWDIVFGQYSHLFDPTFPYLVTGVISNRNGVEVAEVFDKSFEEIAFSDVANYPFSSDIDIIGYDWKEFVGASYIIDLHKNYIVKTTEGLYYKIHFIDFYNDLGDKGNPVFEVGAL